MLRTPKENYDPVVQPQKRPLDFHDFADKLKCIIPESVLYTAVPKPKVDFMRESLSMNEAKNELPNINNYLVSSNTCGGFYTNIKENICSGVTAEIEMATRGQSDDLLWFSFRKGIITASKSHEVMVKMKKAVSVGGGVAYV